MHIYIYMHERQDGYRLAPDSQVLRYPSPLYFWHAYDKYMYMGAVDRFGFDRKSKRYCRLGVPPSAVQTAPEFHC